LSKRATLALFVVVAVGVGVVGDFDEEDGHDEDESVDDAVETQRKIGLLLPQTAAAKTNPLAEL
jgi:hypothetical protein